MSGTGDVEDRVSDLETWKGDIERRFADAFPGGDHVGHCRYHDLMIENIDEKKRLRAAIIEKTVGGLVWAAMVATGIAIWQYLKTQLKG